MLAGAVGCVCVQQNNRGYSTLMGETVIVREAPEDRRSWNWGERAKYYLGRYGVWPTVARAIGGRWPQFWHWMGGVATKDYLRDWLRGDGEKILNLGGGGNVRSYWLTADVDPHADVYLDISRRLPIPSDSVDGVFLEEVIEHVPFEAGRKLLVECKRILKPGGWIRLSTPDPEWLVRVGSDESPTQSQFAIREAERFFGRRVESAGLIGLALLNLSIYSHGHCCIYTWGALRSLLDSVGFHAVVRSCYRDSSSVGGKYDSHADRFNHEPELSLYVEARA